MSHKSTTELDSGDLTISPWTVGKTASTHLGAVSAKVPWSLTQEVAGRSAECLVGTTLGHNEALW